MKVWALVYSVYGAPSKPAIKFFAEDAPPSTAEIAEWLLEQPGITPVHATAMAKEVAEAGESKSFPYEWCGLSQEEVNR